MHDPDGGERLLGRLYAAAVITMYTGTFFVLWFPMLFLATGIQAIGRELGWWVGDEMANDGEETLSTAIGLIGSVMFLTIAAALTLLVASVLGRRMRGAFRAVLIGSTTVVLAHGVIATVIFTDSP